LTSSWRRTPIRENSTSEERFFSGGLPDGEILSPTQTSPSALGSAKGILIFEMGGGGGSYTGHATLWDSATNKCADHYYFFPRAYALHFWKLL